MSELVLQARGVVYYSANDEAAFFEWLDKLACVASYTGRGDTLYITLDPTALDDPAFVELFALHQRYNINPTQLKPLAPTQFKPWFTD